MMLAPVSIVILTGIAALITEMLRPKQNNNVIVGVSLAGLSVAAISVFLQLGQPAERTFNGMILRDQFGLMIQLLLIGVCFVCFLFSEGYLRHKRIAYAEFYPLALWSTAGGMIMAGTSNMLMIFLGLEVLSISLYCLAGMSRNEQKSEESSLKYFLLGAFASAFLLFGISFFFGMSGSLELENVMAAFIKGEDSLKTLGLFGSVLVIIGLGFKMALVPFHQWSPDVYQGAPTNVTAFMAAASKAAAIAALVRFLTAMAPVREFWMPILFAVAIATMLVGNFAALVQKDVKRVLGYSSIANAGYLLVAIFAHVKYPDKIGLGTLVFFLMGYSFMTIGALAVVSTTAKSGNEGTTYQDLNGMFKRNPFAAGMLVLFMAGLIGIPPTAGFFGKLQIFQNALQTNLVPLAIVLGVTSAASVFYYLKIAVAAFVDDEGAVPAQTGSAGGGLKVALILCAAGTLVFGLFMTGMTDFIAGPNNGIMSRALPNAKAIEEAGPRGLRNKATAEKPAAAAVPISLDTKPAETTAPKIGDELTTLGAANSQPQPPVAEKKLLVPGVR